MTPTDAEEHDQVVYAAALKALEIQRAEKISDDPDLVLRSKKRRVRKVKNSDSVQETIAHLKTRSLPD